MAKLQVDVPDELFDRFRRKHYRSMNKRITTLMEEDMSEGKV